MSLRKIFSLIAMIIIVYLIVNMFVIPYIGDPSDSFGYWEWYDEADLIIIPILTLVALGLAFVTTLLQLCGVLKDSKFANFGIGFNLAANILFIGIFGKIYENSSASVSAGAWLGLIFSSIAFAIILVGNLLSNEKKQRPMNYYTPVNEAPIVGYDPNTGEPIYAKPKGYNPRTGEPIYN